MARRVDGLWMLRLLSLVLVELVVDALEPDECEV
jgi:hypothetical protein